MLRTSVLTGCVRCGSAPDEAETEEEQRFRVAESGNELPGVWRAQPVGSETCEYCDEPINRLHLLEAVGRATVRGIEPNGTLIPRAAGSEPHRSGTTVGPPVWNEGPASGATIGDPTSPASVTPDCQWLGRLGRCDGLATRRLRARRSRGRSTRSRPRRRR